jgi:adenylate kinase family enzyme
LDDSQAIVKKRLDTFERERMPIVNLFTKSKNLVHINSQRKVENVFKQITAYLDKLVENIEVRLPEVVFFSGPVGSGRATQLKAVKENYEFCTIDTAEVLKKAAETDEFVRGKINSGALVDSETVVNLLGDAMDEKDSQAYVISGFPKSMDNWEAWNRKMNNTCHVRSFFSFECGQAALMDRLKFRNDPNEDFELVKKRHDTFNQNIEPVKQKMQ